MTTEAAANSGLPAIHPQAARLFACRLASSIAASASRRCRRNAGLVFISLITSVLVAEFGEGSGVAAYRILPEPAAHRMSGGEPSSDLYHRVHRPWSPPHSFTESLYSLRSSALSPRERWPVLGRAAFGTAPFSAATSFLDCGWLWPVGGSLWVG